MVCSCGTGNKKIFSKDSGNKNWFVVKKFNLRWILQNLVKKLDIWNVTDRILKQTGETKAERNVGLDMV